MYAQSRRYRSNLGNMRFNWCDLSKFLLVLCFSVFCAWTAVNKFIVQQYFTNGAAGYHSVKISPNYDVCEAVLIANHLQPDYLTCKTEITDAFSLAKSKCKDYISLVNNCYKSNGYCNPKETVMESCINVVIKPTVQKWTTFRQQQPQQK
jgi:hypothetical protein